MSSRTILIILTAINYLNYIDRLILSAVLSSIKIDLSLSDLQAGLLATAFTLPYMLTSPLFGYLGDTQNRSRIISLGAGLWSVATFFTGLAKSFPTLLSTRFALGIGESAFTTTSMPYLSDFFPAAQHGRIFAIFNTASPVGAALGFVLGGILGKFIGWRNAFLIVGIPGFILAMLLWCTPDPRKKSEEKFTLLKALSALKKSKSYVFAVLGFAANTFVVGGVAHWMPTYLQRILKLSELSSNALFGGIAVVSGIVGTLIGGYVSDALVKKYAGGNQLLCAVCMVIAAPCFYLSIITDDIYIFSSLLTFTLIFIFMATSPINIAFIESISPRFRNTAMAIAILGCHLLGDSISPPIIGYISDLTGSLRNGVLACTPLLIVAGIFWLLGAKERTKEVRNATGSDAPTATGMT